MSTTILVDLGNLEVAMKSIDLDNIEDMARIKNFSHPLDTLKLVAEIRRLRAILKTRNPQLGSNLIHYAPYGPYANGQFSCGTNSGSYTGEPSWVNCEECKRRSPGLWPEYAKDQEGDTK